MRDVLLDTLCSKACNGDDIKQLLKLVSALVLKHRYSHPDAFRKFECLELMFESKDWEGKESLPLQANLIAVLELLK